MIERVGLTARGFLALQVCEDGGEPVGRLLRDERSTPDRRRLVGAALAAAAR